MTNLSVEDSLGNPFTGVSAKGVSMPGLGITPSDLARALTASLVCPGSGFEPPQSSHQPEPAHFQESRPELVQ